jgi:hypothetical protein
MILEGLEKASEHSVGKKANQEVSSVKYPFHERKSSLKRVLLNLLPFYLKLFYRFLNAP